MVTNIAIGSDDCPGTNMSEGPNSCSRSDLSTGVDQSLGVDVGWLRRHSEGDSMVQFLPSFSLDMFGGTSTQTTNLYAGIAEVADL